MHSLRTSLGLPLMDKGLGAKLCSLGLADFRQAHRVKCLTGTSGLWVTLHLWLLTSAVLSMFQQKPWALGLRLEC